MKDIKLYVASVILWTVVGTANFVLLLLGGDHFPPPWVVVPAAVIAVCEFARRIIRTSN